MFFTDLLAFHFRTTSVWFPFLLCHFHPSQHSNQIGMQAAIPSKQKPITDTHCMCETVQLTIDLKGKNIQQGAFIAGHLTNHILPCPKHSPTMYMVNYVNYTHHRNPWSTFDLKQIGQKQSVIIMAFKLRSGLLSIASYKKIKGKLTIYLSITSLWKATQYQKDFT